MVYLSFCCSNIASKDLDKLFQHLLTWVQGLLATLCVVITVPVRPTLDLWV